MPGTRTVISRHPQPYAARTTATPGTGAWRSSRPFRLRTYHLRRYAHCCCHEHRRPFMVPSVPVLIKPHRRNDKPRGTWCDDDRFGDYRLAADAFDIKPSRDSFIKEGWQSIDNQKIDKLHKLAPSFLDRLTPRSQAAAQSLLRDLASLRQIGNQTPKTNSLVFCHHDIRQSNMAWHPNYGTRLVDWSWSGLGESGSDITSLLIDLHKSHHDISPYQNIINLDYCLTLIGFWLNHATWPHHGNDTTRFQQFLSALSAYEIYING